MKIKLLIVGLLLAIIFSAFVYRTRQPETEEVVSTYDEPINVHTGDASLPKEEEGDNPIANDDMKISSKDERQLLLEEHLASLLPVQRYLFLEEDNDKPPRIYIKNNLTVENLPEIRSMLSDPKFARSWYKLLPTLCYLEPDPVRALNDVNVFLKTKVDWSSRGGVYVEEGYNKILSISAAGYIESTEAKDYLAQYLDRKNALQLAKQINVPSRHYTSVEQAATIIQRGAANGLLFAHDDEYFELVYNAFNESIKEGHGTDWESHRLTTALSSAIGQYRFFQKFGLEEGHRLLHEASNMGDPVLGNITLGYEPQWTEKDQKEEQQ